MNTSTSTTLEATGRGSDQFMLRLPAGLRGKLKVAAAHGRRSLNAEIINLIERGIHIAPVTVEQSSAPIGDQIRVARNLCGLSLAAVGERLSVSAQAIHKWETGEAYPSHENLLAVSALLGVQCGATTQQPDETRRAAAPARPASLVLHELLAAEAIIIVMLGVMTTDQKLAIATKLDELGVSGAGATRFHERRAALVAAGAA